MDPSSEALLKVCSSAGSTKRPQSVNELGSRALDRGNSCRADQQVSRAVGEQADASWERSTVRAQKSSSRREASQVTWGRSPGPSWGCLDLLVAEQLSNAVLSILMTLRLSDRLCLCSNSGTGEQLYQGSRCAHIHHTGTLAVAVGGVGLQGRVCHRLWSYRY